VTQTPAGGGSGESAPQKATKALTDAEKYVFKDLGTFQMTKDTFAQLKESAGACREMAQGSASEAGAKLDCYVKAIQVARDAAKAKKFNITWMDAKLKTLHAAMP
jgi:enamine deaminase RidA (YjgF/YER057c/UK114 family)